MALELGMDLYSLILLSVGLAMDAFSVATVTGFGLSKIKIKDATRMSVSFGAAHVLMPVLGWFLGSTVVDLISSYDHWVAFLLLLFVGVKMIKEGVDGDEEINPEEILGTMSLIMFTVAVSIDALAVGLSFSLQQLPILIPSLFMGAGTLIFTFIGLMAGSRTGKAFGKKAQILGGLVLIFIGARIVLSHNGFAAIFAAING
ncbi:MAG: manganese efflux pump MntP family protein [Candidatus Bathyarchaeota archaeon]|nr:manganese efflux pump MntP family protein [Candidatus Bathyarchaeota archaeon]